MSAEPPVTPADLSTRLGPLRLDHPLLDASGTFDLLEYATRYDGDYYADFPYAAYVPKTVTADARQGNPSPRVTETPSGMINAIGLENPGIEVWIRGLASWARLTQPVIVSVGGNEPAQYALEGSIAITGALVQWVRDNLGMIEKSSDIESLAASVDDNGGAYFVPAFSGLFAPYWKSDARGVIAGLTRYVNKGHIARAVLEATAWQTREVLDAMNADSGVPLTALKVDGGMVYNNLLMQFQSDVLKVPVIRPKVAETTALGAAYAAGLAVGYWAEVEDLRANWAKDHEWHPTMDAAKVDAEYASWKKAVTRTFGWVE